MATSTMSRFEESPQGYAARVRKRLDARLRGERVGLGALCESDYWHYRFILERKLGSITPETQSFMDSEENRKAMKKKMKPVKAEPKKGAKKPAKGKRC